MSDLSLPIPAERLIPHRPPMQLITTLLDYIDGGGTAETTVPEDSILVTADGRLSPVALVEMTAQAVAAFSGYEDMLAGQDVHEGFLVGVAKAECHETVNAGDRLLIKVKRTAAMDGFAFADGEVFRGDELVASASIRVFVPAKAGEAGQ